MKLVLVAGAWVGGLIIGLEAEAPVSALLLLSVAALALGLLLRMRGVSVWAPLLAAAVLMGVLRVEVPQGPEPLGPSPIPRPVTVRGLVVSDPELSGPGVEFVISIDAVDRGKGWEDGAGRAKVLARPPFELVRDREGPYFRYGDRLELAGTLEEPPFLGDFDYRTYLANQGIHSVLRFPAVRLIDEGEGNPGLRHIYDLRHKLSGSLDEGLPEPQASLAQALLLGLRGRLPEDVKEDFRSIGTSHLLAISGLHVGIVLAAVLGASAWLLGRRRQVYLLLPFGAIWVYALLSGFSASVERAAIMGSVYLLALALGRPKGILPALALAAGVMAGVEPQALKDVSFQLSFTALAGIALLTTSDLPAWSRVADLPTGRLVWWKTLLGAVLVMAAVSAAATVATLPLVAFNFHRIPTLGIPATILALPAMPVLLLTTVAASLGGLVHPVAGQVLGWLAWFPLEYVIRLVQLFSQVPGSTISVPSFSGGLVWAYYAGLALLLLLPRGLRTLGAIPSLGAETWPETWPETWKEMAASLARPPARERPPPAALMVVGVCLAVLAGFLWFYAVTGPDGKLHVHFLDVGQGDSTFIVTPEGRQVLIDGGPGPMSAVRAVGDRMPFWDRDLDLIVLTHPDEDHFRGLAEVLDRYQVDAVVEAGGFSENPLYGEWVRAAER